MTFDSIDFLLSTVQPLIMPTVAVDKADLWERLGHEYCNAKFIPISSFWSDRDIWQPRKTLTSFVSTMDWNSMKMCVQL